LPFGVSDSIRSFSDPISSVLSSSSLSRFPFRRFRLYQILSASDSQSEGVVFPARWAVPTSQTLADHPRQFLIGPPVPIRIEFGRAESNPKGWSYWLV
ncbi:hypothetical protein, partial [Streptomyces griseoluteus]|uniref:hypothetical protein n=1 Tax=Streptomyces griseoluteus TaxID=29306 RepID=UPI003439B4AA